MESGGLIKCNLVGVGVVVVVIVVVLVVVTVVGITVVAVVGWRTVVVTTTVVVLGAVDVVGRVDDVGGVTVTTVGGSGIVIVGINGGAVTMVVVTVGSTSSDVSGTEAVGVETPMVISPQPGPHEDSTASARTRHAAFNTSFIDDSCITNRGKLCH